MRNEIIDVINRAHRMNIRPFVQFPATAVAPDIAHALGVVSIDDEYIVLNLGKKAIMNLSFGDYSMRFLVSRRGTVIDVMLPYEDIVDITCQKDNSH